MNFFGFFEKEKSSGSGEKIKQLNHMIIVLVIILVFLSSLVVYTMLPSFRKVAENRKIKGASVFNHSLKREGDNYTECDCQYQCSVVYGFEIDVNNIALLGTGECLCMHPEKDFYMIMPDEKCLEYELFTRNVVERELDEKRQSLIMNKTGHSDNV